MIVRCYGAGALFFFLISLLGIVAADDPHHQISSFTNRPARLFFFDDSETAIYHDGDAREVYVSQDEGKNWKPADGIPSGQVTMVFEHPFNNRYAFALTRGKKHYRTDDRGKTWRSFEVPSPPAYVARPLAFHSKKDFDGHIIYQGRTCTQMGWTENCQDDTFYTTDAFSTDVKPLLSDIAHCVFAHGSQEFKHEAHDNLIYCVGYDTSSSSRSHSLSASRLFSSTDYFNQDHKVEDMGMGVKNAKGVIAFAIVSKYALVAVKGLTGNGEMTLYVSLDSKTWAKAQFPHASSASLRENAYTILQSTTHSLAVDVVLQNSNALGTLFVSNSNGTFFVQSLADTNRNENGFVDYERIYGIDGVGLANVVANAAEVEGGRARKQLRTVITYDDGSSWSALAAPSNDKCNPSDKEKCALHLHSVTTPHNYGRIFSSPAPGFVMGVGSIGPSLLAYEECDTLLSTDAGISWKMVKKDAHKYEFGDSGSILVVANDEQATDSIAYSLDLGKTWTTYNFGLAVKVHALLTIPDSTSQKFILSGWVPKDERKNDQGPWVSVFLDFAGTRGRKCGDGDMEKWYARSGTSDCLMGHKQWYNRRKPDANCYVGEKFTDPVVHEENCECTDADYECDFNFVRHEDKCVPVGPEPIPAGVCANGQGTYKGSSGWRKIPGNSCTGGNKDEKVDKDCSKAQPAEGEIIHQTFAFPFPVRQHGYFRDSTTILALLEDGSLWQSSSEGYTWSQFRPGEHFLGFYHHPHSSERAYLITNTRTFYVTTDTGRSWNPRTSPSIVSSFPGIQTLRFQPNTERLIWVGDNDCSDILSDKCHTVAHYSRDNGRNWDTIEKYVHNCAWAVDSKLHADDTEIICESYEKKAGSQMMIPLGSPYQLVEGGGYYARKKTVFKSVVGFAKFSEFLVVAEVEPTSGTLNVEVSLDGLRFASGQFPPNINPATHAYTILESSTRALFLHMTTSEATLGPTWGTILKSNSNGTYFSMAIDYVNRNQYGYVDFEKMIGLDGIALVNIVSNPQEAVHTNQKAIQSRITHNDGGTWKQLVPPRRDSQGNEYACSSTKCALHVHGYTERPDPRATYSTPSVVGLLMAVGNVGENLLPYKDSDTFLSRDGGFTWEEVHKDAHLWEFGDSGSIVVMANDEEPTDHVLFSTDEGSNWREYKFTDERMRVRSIVTVPADNSRRFILLGEMGNTRTTTAVHIDFSALTTKQCVYNPDDPQHDDFELWSPSEERTEICLFGRQTLYHRRKRDANCVIGKKTKVEPQFQKNCACSDADFECEFNHIRDSNGKCVLVPGTQPLADDEDGSCANDEDFWFSRTEYRKIPYSTCEDGKRPDRGAKHSCPGLKGHSAWFWLFILFIPFGITVLVGYSYYRRAGLVRGTIRLPGDGRGVSSFNSDSGVLATLASVPWFLVGLSGIAWEWVTSRLPQRRRSGYRNIPIDEDAQILRFEDEE